MSRAAWEHPETQDDLASEVKRLSTLRAVYSSRLRDVIRRVGGKLDLAKEC